ncbi:tail fiber domain-containing protein [Ensifer adhaerens]|uniref:tail fiber domain-containing protein n=1 Tax=Ensifer adhaerens TaxID=106592 RepID=UPI001CC0C804|nr:tail fiber domain-containing protein [Ensifer adhaerens]MBZ7920558.1 tail fiber domain-containing protein [Ensifer adhaerens]UAX93034.1 tail fiber domain-containing protein [Ensifer adhaerens]UAY00670.1 tail fiber domain-containing protein [Ensifer adhaerens]UAY08051.1 tail fiber domain-containing protein [Ensifer adhaerens]
MGKSKAPKAPDPKETAAAQTSTNIGTAIANQTLGNVNQVTPDGALTYSQTGTKQWKDPTNGAMYDLPQYTATQTLSAGQQAIKDQSDKAELNLATLASGQSAKLNELLGKPVDTSGAPAAGDPSKIGLPQYAGYGAGPTLTTSLPNAGNVQSSIAGAGNIQRDVANAGPIKTSLGDTGNITNTYDYSADTSRYENALMERMNPQLAQSRSALETQLANQGLQPGSEAYNRAIDAASRQENDARLGAILNAGQEQSRLAGLARDQATFQNSAQQQNFNQALAAAGLNNQAQAQQYGQNANNMQQANAAQAQQFSQNAAQLEANNAAQNQNFQQGLASAGFGNDAKQQMYQNQNTTTAANNALKDQTFNAQQAQLAAQNNARSQYLNELYAQRNQPINEISSLLSGAQVNNPNFVPTQGVNIPNVDYAGLVQQDYANKVNAYNAKQAGIGSILGGVAGLASLSDERAKKDIKQVGGLYEYRYKGEGKNAPKRIGVMAQEVEKIRPEVVIKGDDGLRRVDYGALFAAGRQK